MIRVILVHVAVVGALLLALSNPHVQINLDTGDADITMLYQLSALEIELIVALALVSLIASWRKRR